MKFQVKTLARASIHAVYSSQHKYVKQYSIYGTRPLESRSGQVSFLGYCLVCLLDKMSRFVR